MRAAQAYRLAAGAAVTLVLAACGGGQRQDAQEPSGNFPVEASATFATTQQVASHHELVITVRNVGHRAITDVAVTICNESCSSTAPGQGTNSIAFANEDGPSFLAHPEIPTWIVDRPPDTEGCGYSCRGGGAGGAATADPNTWAMGRLAPGQTTTFIWKVTALEPGEHVLAWAVGGGLNGKSHAVTSGGGVPSGTIPVSISRAPAKQYVDNAGQIVSNPQ